jgi:hypothetical protein
VRFRMMKRGSLVVVVLAACLLPSGCRCSGFYSPVYSQKELKRLLQKNAGELTAFAAEWFRDHRDDGMRYQGCRTEKITFTRYSRNGTGIASSTAITPGSSEAGTLKEFAKRLKLEDVSVFRTSADTRTWYVELSFQGGSKWPYGLIYVPDGEPLNMLNSASGKPGPGFSRVVPLQGRWFYFESR